MTKWFFALAATAILGQPALAADYQVKKLEDGPPADVLSAEVVAQLEPTGYQVTDDKGKTVCDLWLAKKLDVQEDFQPTLTILYPITSGSLVGAIKFPEGGSDFRGQEIPEGTYTLRYGNQPEDGNHIGTFDTRDFLLMLPAAADQDPATLAGTDFFATSAEAAESSHPAIMPLLQPQGDDAPSLEHVDQVDWWVLRVPTTDAKGKKHPLEVVVAGVAAE